MLEKDEDLRKHRERCAHIFKRIEEGAELYIRSEYSRSEESGPDGFGPEESGLEGSGPKEMNLEDVRYIRLSVLTGEMMEYDSEMFSIDDEEELLNKYRPYFVSLIVPVDGNEKEIELLGDEWHIGQLIDPEKTSGEGIVLDVILETSASPICYKDKNLLVFRDKKLDPCVLAGIHSKYLINNVICMSNLSIMKALNCAWEGDFPETIDIYNIGHGNADYIRGSRNHRILYDIGYNYRCFPSYTNSKYLKAVTALRQLKPDCVILSHWDLDHFIGCAFAEQDLFRVKWITPNLVSPKGKRNSLPNSVRLANYLMNVGSLCFVDRKGGPRYIATIVCRNNVKMELYLGGGRDDGITNENCEGLMLRISSYAGRYPNVLLAGDVPYKCMGKLFHDPIDFMHVPHHCSKMSLARLKQLGYQGKYAIISTNRDNRHGKNQLCCDGDHYITLKSKFTDVISTIDDPVHQGNLSVNPCDDERNLSIQINYRNGKLRFR